MFYVAVRLLIRQWFERNVPLASAALFLLLAFHTESFATTLPASVHEPLPLASPLAVSPGCEEENADGVRIGACNREPLIRNTIFTAATSSHTGVVAEPDAETAAGESPPLTAAAEKRIPDWNGVWRDTGILFGSQFVAAGIIYMMPESISGWSSEQKKNSLDKYVQNFTSPVMDKDKFYLNYILHPYWGATYYTRARERGLGKGESFVYSAAISTLFEFGVECFYEKPSIQDLIITPVAGSLVGALIFEPWRDSIKRKGELRWYDHAALVATDPVGVLSLLVEKLFDIKPTIMIEYSVPKVQANFAGSPMASSGTRIGMVWQFPLN